MKRCLPIGDQKSSVVHKITLRNPARTVEVREMLRSTGVVPYEADILFKYRWMNDTNIGGMKWLSVVESNGVSTNSVCSQRTIQIKQMKVVEKDEDVPLKCLALDIETVSDDDSRMPEAEKDPCSLSFLVRLVT